MSAAQLQTILTQPVPGQVVARNRKQGYREYPLLATGPRNQEPLVDIALYGIAGQSYYSRPNRATGSAVPGIDPVIRVRKSIAEQLAAINHALQGSEEIEALFGGPVELYVEEGVRSLELQAQLYEEVFPRFIASRNPKFDTEAVLAERDRMIAKPAAGSSVPPHATGAAIDIALRHAHPELAFVPKTLIPMGRQLRSGTTSSTPDYFEQRQRLTGSDMRLRRNRRVFYWTMRGALLQDDTGFVCNPDEWWHWSYGDQLWAALTQAPCAFFGAAAPERKS